MPKVKLTQRNHSMMKCPMCPYRIEISEHNYCFEGGIFHKKNEDDFLNLVFVFYLECGVALIFEGVGNVMFLGVGLKCSQSS